MVTRSTRTYVGQERGQVHRMRKLQEFEKMWLFLAFLAVPLIEISLFIQVGGAIGLGWTLIIVILTAILGTWLVRSQGMREMSNLRRSFSELSDPTESLAHGAMILVSGALLLTPGFFTDGVGFALLVPGIRTAVFHYLRKRVKVQSFAMGPDVDTRQNQGHPQKPANSDIIDGELQELDPTKRPTHSSSGWTKH